MTLLMYGREVTSIFGLLGAHEDHITRSIGWALANSPVFCSQLVQSMFSGVSNVEDVTIRLQTHKGVGVTDLEIIDVHVVAEAKRGWALPTTEQLRKYLAHFEHEGRGARAYLVLSECSADFAARKLPRSLDGMPVHHLSWRQIHALADPSLPTAHKEKQILQELRAYLGGIVSMQDQESNMVFVVALSTDTRRGWSISWRDIVVQKGMYFHPADKHWPKQPPNYIAFRYGGRLQSIHHVDSWQIVEEMHEHIPEIPLGPWPAHFLYRLSAPIGPAKTVKTGSIYRSGRVWAMIDLLLTCDSVSEARDKTEARLHVGAVQR